MSGCCPVAVRLKGVGLGVPLIAFMSHIRNSIRIESTVNEIFRALIQSQRGENAKCLVVHRAKYVVMGNSGQTLVLPHGEGESGCRQPV